MPGPARSAQPKECAGSAFPVRVHHRMGTTTLVPPAVPPDSLNVPCSQLKRATRQEGKYHSSTLRSPSEKLPENLGKQEFAAHFHSVSTQTSTQQFEPGRGGRRGCGAGRRCVPRPPSAPAWWRCWCPGCATPCPPPLRGHTTAAGHGEHASAREETAGFWRGSMPHVKQPEHKGMRAPVRSADECRSAAGAPSSLSAPSSARPATLTAACRRPGSTMSSTRRSASPAMRVPAPSVVSPCARNLTHSEQAC